MWIYQVPKIRKEKEKEKLIIIDGKKFEDDEINGDKKERKTGTNRKKMRRNGKLFGMVRKMCGKFPSSKVPKFQSSKVTKF